MNYRLLVLSIVIFISTYSLYSSEPLVRFYLQDGSIKSYNLSEIDSLNMIDKKNNYVMRIHYQDTLIAYYPIEIIGSIKFEKDSAKHDILNVYIFSYPKSYILSSIDSVIFYIDPYQPLTIGSQVWMLKNLNVDHYRNEDSIPEVRDSVTWANLTAGAWCYYKNDSSNGAIYGKLYNWYAVNDPRGLAPVGWRVPSDNQWTELDNHLGGSILSGGKLKSIGTKESSNGLWYSPNTGATNESGFSALPGGYRDNIGSFGALGIGGGLWTSSEVDSRQSWYRGLHYNYAYLGKFDTIKENGFSVRCVKD